MLKVDENTWDEGIKELKSELMSWYGSTNDFDLIIDISLSIAIICFLIIMLLYIMDL